MRSSNYGASLLEIEVADDGHRAARGAGDGNGLRGIAERARALGGSVESGPRPGGGFALRARLPIEESADVTVVAAAPEAR